VKASTSQWIDARVFLFDVEGTLVNAVPLTLRCWSETLADFGQHVSVERLKPLSGMDGRDMLAHLLPGLTDETTNRILERQGDRYRSRYLPQVRAFPQVAELFGLLRDAGKSIGLATDSSRDELDRYVEVAGIGGLIDARACGNEASRGKPHPDILHLALEKLGASPHDAVMIGDTPFDALAARNAGARAIGVLTGGFPESDLIKAGAEAVLPDMAALRATLQPLLQPPDRKAS